MKSKISPTSPKSSIKKEDSLKNLYSDELNKIEKPQKKRTSTIAIILLAIFFGLLAGVLSQIILFTYGSSIPIIDKLNIFNNTTQTSIIVGSGKNQSANVAQVNQQSQKISATIARIFKIKSEEEGLQSAYLDSASLGDGFIITNDGYLVTTKQVVGDSQAENYVVFVQGNVKYEVKEIIPDPATNFVFIKIDAKGLDTVAFSKNDELLSLTDLFLFQPHFFSQTPSILNAQIVAPIYYAQDKIEDIVKSSELMDRKILIGNEIPASFNYALAFTGDSKAVGIVQTGGSQNYIIPFSQITGEIESILAQGKINQAYLGVHYVDLAEVVNLPVEISSNLSKGAVIYSDDEEARPSVEKNSPAQKGGLQTGDIIQMINNTELSQNMSLNDFISRQSPGDLLTMRIMRGGKSEEIKITLEKLNNE
ncbi:MAG: S1C family serine protease [Patescibacteria group bacterium]|jgi:S1-C subfamily serine protease